MSNHVHLLIETGRGGLPRLCKEEAILRPKTSVSVVFRSAARGVGVEPEVLRSGSRRAGHANAGVGRLRVDPAARYKLKEVAGCLGRDMATVSSMVSRFAGRLGEDARLRSKAKRLAKIV